MSRPPEPARSAAAAGWLLNVNLWAAEGVTGWVGSGFEQYARVLHPLGNEDDAPTWADVAATHGRTVVPTTTWAEVLGVAEVPGRSYPGDPTIGTLQPVALEPLCRILTRHTSTPDLCWFAVWEGWGWIGDAEYSLVTSSSGPEPISEPVPTAIERHMDATAASFELPGRTYLLYQGVIGQATTIGWWPLRDWFIPQSPSLFWPQDHAWCVATEVDADFTVVGGSADLISAVLRDPRLDAQPLPPDLPRSSLG